jgi:acetyl-CoA carboxylase carboxyl transferase subunit alpha
MADRKIVPLEFEQPLALLSQQIDALEKQVRETNSAELEKDLGRLNAQYDQLRRSLYSNLRGIDHLALARHSQRPYTRDYFERWDPNWVELHGDRKCADDAALVAGLLNIGGERRNPRAPRAQQ